MDISPEIIAICTIIYAVASEIIGASRLKDNTVIQAVMTGLGFLFGKRERPE